MMEGQEEFEQAIAAADAALRELKERFAQVLQDQNTLTELQSDRQRIKTEKPPAWKTELAHIEAQIETIALNLESRLIQWQSFKEPFWQTVRFGGLGFILGWLLHSWLRS
ncbi:hypothetical protein [Spirulina major]|uniref:hypothetical protein n=1 Tax=Spirulina major TaxID=270636 RepID=UPI000933E3C7|nr:hypothetical protein [Spirulina major]